MPLTRYEVKNEYGLADPELYRAVDTDDPEALLEGVAMAGLVGVLRQLGDLAEFAAEIFHDLHEEVLSTAARGYGLMVRVQQLEAEVPSIEKALLSQTNHSLFFSNTGTEWHSNIRSEQNLIARGDLPRFIMDSYEECRGPPRLFLLDKFDVGGAGACLKRYSDPSFFKVEATTNGVATVETQRERKTRKAKKRGSCRRNGETPEIVPTSHTKLHQLLLEERIENSYTDPARLIKLKKRQLDGSAIDPKSGKSYMEKFLGTPSPEHKEVCQTSIILPRLTYISENTCDSGHRVLEISTVSPAKSSSGKNSACSSLNSHEVVSKPLVNGFTEDMADRELVKVSVPTTHEQEFEIPSVHNETEAEKLLAVSAEDKTVGSVNGYDSDGVTSEVDNYMDALATIESELETDNEYRPKNNLPVLYPKRHGTDSDSNDEHLELQAQLSESQSTGNFSTSDYGIKKGRSSFSYHDTPSSFVETSDFDTFAKVSPSETLGAETVCVPSNQLAIITESLGTKYGDPVMSDDTCIQEDVQEDKVLDIRGLSSIDPSPEPFYLDPGTSLPMVSPTGLNETHEIENKETNVVDFAIVIPDVSSETIDDSKKTSQSYPLNDLDNGDLSNILEASAQESRVCLVNEVFETQYMDSDSYQSLVGDEIDSTTVASTEVQCLPDVECHSRALILSDGLPASSTHYSDVNKAEDLDTKIDTVVTAVRVVEDLPYIMITAQNCVSEELPSRVDSPEANSLVQQQLSGLFECVTHVSVDAGVTYFTGKSNLEEIPGTADKEEITQCTSSVDEVKENGVSQQLESSGLNDPGEESHANFDDVVPEAVKVEYLEVPSAITFNAIDVDNNLISTDKVCSPSGHITSLQEPVCGFVDPYKKEMEWNEVGSPECLTWLEKGMAACVLVVASEDLGVNPSNFGSSDHSSSEIECVQELSATEQNENSLTISDVTASSTHLELSNRESEPKSSCHNHPVNNSEDDMSSSTFHLIELSKESLKLQTDQVEAESLKMDNSGYHLHTPLDHLKFRDGQLDEECLPTDEAHINSLNRSIEKIDLLYPVVEGSCRQRESPEYINQELHSDASLESSQGDLASQHSTSETSAQSGGQEVENTKQSLNQLESTRPSFILLPEAAQLDSGEMPPLPPLPPVQWRMGRFQFASEVSQKDLLKVNPDLFPPKQPTKDDMAQIESQTSLSQMEQPLNPFLPLEALVNEKSQQGPELENLAQSISHSLQLPTMADANIQYNYLASEETQSSNPIFTVPTSNGRSGGNNLGLEGEMAQSSSNSLSPIPTIEHKSLGDDQVVSQEVIQPLNQVALENGLDEHEQSLPKSGGEQGNLPDTFVPSSTMVDQSQLLWMPEGERAWVSSSYAMMPESEVGKPNGNPVNKLPRPRNPLIDAVAAHGKSKLRKVTERLRPEIEPKVDERDSLLEQIRTKSFNLKPAPVSRPSVQGPKTNLRVAAILEKANAIRQAWVGSDEDDDENNWSDC